ncbi:MAG: T9SS type A sorting domain-containing protein, partial [Aliifodinibius sp.]|nr:T9SS type A sorting domain-containing protein [Fodinibius sp.]NIV11209.1 T9SS type A sorting domain-containing protein [Fodinibius sp.]NIY24801.1 T9SS type A sorting domain-containing protein [Fodinibius sp.]
GTSTFHTAFWDAMGVPAGFAPSIPDSFVAYSDYTTPTSMSLTWNDPTTLVNGDTLNPGTYSINIKRDGVFLDSVAGGVETYTDTGLVDGIEYTYSIAAELDSSGFESDTVQATWIAGGSPFPNPPQNLIVAGTQNEVTLTWINPSDNIDGTPMDDFAGINLYQNGALVTTFARTSADTARRDTAVYTPSTPGFYEWHMTAIDNESPSNESDPTAIVGTPLSVPIADQFTDPGEPNVGIWINTTTDINDRAVNPPSPSYSLNLNGMPNGEDIIDLKPVDLSGMQGSGIVFSYYYQPQGTGNEPETGDSLRVYFKNDLNEWVLVRAYPGMPVQPFTEEVIDIETAPHGGGSYFHGQFQARFRSTGGAANIPNDDWFVDDVSLGPPVGIEEEKDRLPMQFAVMPNYPNPFNPTTTIEYQLPRASTVKLVIYNTLGQMVRTLVNQSMEAGVHQAVWDGRNERGKQVASGIYVYRFSAESADDKAGSFQQVNKMILLK